MAPEEIERQRQASTGGEEDLKFKNGNVLVISEETRAITQEEHKLGVLEAARLYPRTVLWAMFLSLPLIGIQYDETVMGAFYALPAFQKRYGRPVGGGDYLVPPQWQAAISMAGYIGQVFGSLGVAAWPLERFGPRRTLSVAVFGVTCCIFIMFFAVSIEMLFVGELIQGIISGSFIVICVSYASELTPLSLRGILTSYANLCAVTGQFIGTGVTFALEGRKDQWAYRIPFAVQWWWCILFFAFIWFTPESPYWLVRRGREEEAVRVLTKLSRRPDAEQDARERVTLIRETDRIEKELSRTATVADCFRGANLRRTEICVVTFIIQVWGGGSLMGYSTLLFELAGLPDKNAFALSLGAKAFSFMGTIVAWFLLPKIGRRTLFCYGEVILSAFLFLIGILAVVPHNLTNPGLQNSQAVLLMLFSFVYDCTIGPIVYVFLGEISSTRMRGKTIAVALAIKAVLGVVSSESMPYFMNKGEGYWRGKAGFLYGGINLAFTVWCFFRIPETKNRSFEEIDRLFELGVPARDFKKYVSDADVGMH